MPRYLSPIQPRYPELKPRLAAPAPPPSYVIPGSQYLDPPYSQMLNPCAPPWMQGKYPFPRNPWPFESETRAFGTGLIQTDPCQPTQPCPPQSWYAPTTAMRQQRQWWR